MDLRQARDDVRGDRAPPRVLVVDNVHFATVVADGLARRGFRATPFHTIRTALAALGVGEFDALVTELDVGRESGMDLVVAAAKRAPQMARILICGQRRGIELDAVEHGAVHAYVRKPLDLTELQAVIASHLPTRAPAHD